MSLHITRVAYGCTGLDMLIDRMAMLQADGVVRLSTRNAPKRVEELKGGSLFWIIRHQLVARSPLLGFEPQHRLENSLAPFVEWVRQSPAVDNGSRMRQQLEERGLVT